MSIPYSFVFIHKKSYNLKKKKLKKSMIQKYNNTNLWQNERISPSSSSGLMLYPSSSTSGVFCKRKELKSVFITDAVVFFDSLN